MKSIGMIRGQHMDFYILESKQGELMMESGHRTMVDVNQPIETLQNNSQVLGLLEIVNNELFNLNYQTKTEDGSTFQVYAWMAEFTSDMTDKTGYKVVYSVRFLGEKLKKEHLHSIEDKIYEFQSQAEMILKANFRRISELTGREVFVF